MRAFHKALREGNQKLPQCKLLVLEEACVGKTSLLCNMTGLKFEPNLERTRGIDNQCIETMIDSTKIDIINWRAFGENEQASRYHVSFVKGFAEAYNKVNDPDLIGATTTKSFLMY